MIDKYEIIKNALSKEDKILFSKIFDQMNFCCKNCKQTYTDFLPIIKASEFLSLIKNNYIEQKLETFGGYDSSERIVIGFSPDYMEFKKENFPISIIEITYIEKYSKELKHRDFLGSMLGLGVDRSKIGDIIVENNKAICFVLNEIVNYININLDKVGSTKVKTDIFNINDYNIPKSKYEEKRIIVSSLRIDTILSSAFNIARGKISNFIKSNKAFVNFQIENNVSRNVKENDIITLRGLGRIKIIEIIGRTKKDNIILNITKYT